jgi:hypothetical protein
MRPQPTINISDAAMLSLYVWGLLLRHLGSNGWWDVDTNFGSIELLDRIALVEKIVLLVKLERLEFAC